MIRTLTAVAAVGAGDELLRPLVTVLLLGPEAEAADGDGLRHRLGGGGERRQRRWISDNKPSGSCRVQDLKLRLTTG